MMVDFAEVFLRAHCAWEGEGSQPGRTLSSPIDLSSGVIELLSFLPFVTSCFP